MRKRRIWPWILLTIVGVMLVVVLFNHEWLYDFYKGMNYAPSDEMARIRSDLELTQQGEFWFNATQPRLSGAGEFNAHCRPDEKTETAVLGCYTGGEIYVYDIDAEELKGIRELTAAHELLHASWERMSGREKDALKSFLQQVLKDNQDVLEGELNVYDEAEKMEELYVRTGTEIKQLPNELEKHYAEIFRDRGKVVNYYESYIAVFRELEAEMVTLKTEMEGIEADINTKIDEYEKRVAELNAEVESFNGCAAVEGCFASEWEFNVKRNELLAKQAELGNFYGEIDQLIEEYNAKVELYNKDVVRTEDLNQKVNSTSQLEKVQ